MMVPFASSSSSSSMMGASSLRLLLRAQRQGQGQGRRHVGLLPARGAGGHLRARTFTSSAPVASRSAGAGPGANANAGGGSAGSSRKDLWGAAAGVLGLVMLSAALNVRPASLEASRIAEPPKSVTPKAAGDPEGKLISMAEVEEHASPENGLWVVIKGNVYDVTDFVDSHPGGRNIILKNAGKDVTDLYVPVHPPNALDDNLDPSAHLGPVDPKTVKVTQKTESEADKKRRLARENLPPVGAVLNLDDFEKAARDILSDQAWAYYASAGDDEISMRHNRSAYSRIWFKPRVMRAVGEVDSSSTMLAVPRTDAPGSVDAGHKVSLPIYISPAAMAKLGHPDGELNLTRGAGKTGIVQGISANASVGLDEMLDARVKNQPIIYQLYVNKDRSASERLLRKVEERGCSAVFLTVDAPVMGKRERDMRAKGDVVETGGGEGGEIKGGGVAAAISGYIDPNLSWDDVAWFKRASKLPLFLKGVQCVADVELAVKHGVQGVVLSNHGGRSLDFAPAPIDILVELRQTRPDLLEKIEVYVDGGVRRGTDVIKALCLGAKAVGLGRPFLYAQSGWGEAGVVRAVQILEDEIQRGMRLLGVTCVDQLTPDLIDILPRTFVPYPTEPQADR